MSANAQVYLPDEEVKGTFVDDGRLKSRPLGIAAPVARLANSGGAKLATGESAFSERLVRCLARLQRLARRLAACSANADDLVQETLVHALEHADHFTSDSTDQLYRWLSAILKNLHCDQYRVRRRELLTDRLDSHPSAQTEPHVSLWRTLNDDAVETAMGTLSPALGQTYRLFVSGLAYEAIASQLSIPISTVGVRIYRARKQLRALLTAAGAARQR